MNEDSVPSVNLLGDPFINWCLNKFHADFFKSFHSVFLKSFPQATDSLKDETQWIPWIKENEKAKAHIALTIRQHVTSIWPYQKTYSDDWVTMLKLYAKEINLRHGSKITIHYEREGCPLFWDAEMNELLTSVQDLFVPGAYHSYACAVPMHFRVGPDGFSPMSWMQGPNPISLVFPTPLFMDQLHTAFLEPPKKIIKYQFPFNGRTYSVRREIRNWKAIVLDITPYGIDILQGELSWFQDDEPRRKAQIRKHARKLKHIQESSFASDIPENVLGHIGHFVTGIQPMNTLQNSIRALKKNHNRNGLNGGRRKTVKFRRV
jgi:hypothetical protein